MYSLSDSLQGRNLILLLSVCLFVFPSHRVMARHAWPCSLHVAVRALGARAPRRQAPGQLVSTTRSGAEGAEGGLSREQTDPAPAQCVPGGPSASTGSYYCCSFTAAIRLIFKVPKLDRNVSRIAMPWALSLPSSSTRILKRNRAHKTLRRRPRPLGRKLAFHVPPARCTAAVTRTPTQRSQ